MEEIKWQQRRKRLQRRSQPPRKRWPRREKQLLGKRLPRRKLLRRRRPRRPLLRRKLLAGKRSNFRLTSSPVRRACQKRALRVSGFNLESASLPRKYRVRLAQEQRIGGIGGFFGVRVAQILKEGFKPAVIGRRYLHTHQHPTKRGTVIAIVK
jgi:hypothetical protein